MEVHNLIDKVLFKVAPIDVTERDKITQDAARSIAAAKQKVKDKEEKNEPLNLLDKAVKLLDSWPVRLGLALSYFVIVRYIQDLMRQDSEPEVHDDYKH